MARDSVNHGGAHPPDDVILDSMALALLALDERCRITRFNSAAEHLTGHYQSKVVGFGCDSIFEATPCDASCPVQRVLRTGTCQQASIIIQTSDRQALTLVALASPLLGPRKRVIGVVVILRQGDGVSAMCGGASVPLDAVRTQHEAAAIQDALQRSEGNLALAAGALGIHRTTLWRKIKRLGIKL